MANFGAFAGGLAGGFKAGMDMKRDAEDQEFKRKQREWIEADRARDESFDKAIKTTMDKYLVDTVEGKPLDLSQMAPEKQADLFSRLQGDLLSVQIEHRKGDSKMIGEFIQTQEKLRKEKSFEAMQKAVMSGNFADVPPDTWKSFGLKGAPQVVVEGNQQFVVGVGDNDQPVKIPMSHVRAMYAPAINQALNTDADNKRADERLQMDREFKDANLKLNELKTKEAISASQAHRENAGLAREQRAALSDDRTRQRNQADIKEMNDTIKDLEASLLTKPTKDEWGREKPADNKRNEVVKRLLGEAQSAMTPEQFNRSSRAIAARIEGVLDDFEQRASKMFDEAIKDPKSGIKHVREKPDWVRRERDKLFDQYVLGRRQRAND
jgi:hypothetical protein